MWQKRKEITGVSSRSIIELKSILFEQEQEAKNRQSNPEKRQKTIHEIIQNPGLSERNQKDLDQDLEESKGSEVVARKLREKAALYRNMAKGDFDRDDEKFLVDFERKGWEEEKEENGSKDNQKETNTNQIGYNYGGGESAKQKGWEDEEGEEGAEEGSDTKNADTSQKETNNFHYNYTTNKPPPAPTPAYTPVHVPPPVPTPSHAHPHTPLPTPTSTYPHPHAPTPSHTPIPPPAPTQINGQPPNSNFYPYVDANGQQQFYNYYNYDPNNPANFYGYNNNFNNPADPNAYNYYNYYNYDPNYYNYYNNPPNANAGFNNNAPLFPPNANNTNVPNTNNIPNTPNVPNANHIPNTNNTSSTNSVPISTPPTTATTNIPIKTEDPPPPPPKVAPTTHATNSQTATIQNSANNTNNTKKPQKYNFKDYSYNETRDPAEETRKLWEQEAKKESEDYSNNDVEEEEKRRRRIEVLGGVVEELAKGREKAQDTKQKRKQALADRMKMIEERKKQAKGK
eukprot:Phypoly_transcript_06850.p1 GENE.Phypoly_transcript_06850~~Phypoly_transcript_06850.p1  ORF type:complete len:512 (+),score=171.06 Phypoly_transcript_06850:171-1706(+)